MNFQQFLEKWNGKYCEVAGSANAKNQCVDLANAFIRDVLGLAIIEWTNAIDFPSKAGDKYEWILNDSVDKIPIEGDLIIFKIGSNGHISIALDGCTKSKVISFDQNYPIGSPCHVQNHTYSSVIGWLRCKKMESSNISQNTIPSGLYDFLFKENKFSEGDIREGMGIFKSGVVKEYEGRLSRLQLENDDLHNQVIDLEKEWKGKCQEAVREEQIRSENIISNHLIDINRLKEIEIKYRELSESGIRLVLMGIGNMVKRFLVEKDEVKNDGNVDRNENQSENSSIEE